MPSPSVWHRALRRPAADGADRLARTAVDARHLRSPAADAAGVRVFSHARLRTGLIMCPDDAALEPKRASLRSAGARRRADSGRVPSGALSRLAELDVTSLILEGGPTLHEAFCRARWSIASRSTWGPRAVARPGVWHDPSGSSPCPGSTRSPAWTALEGLRVRILGDDVCIEADLDEASANVHGTDRSRR